MVTLVGVHAALALVVFLLAWWAAQRLNDATLVDITWAGFFAALGVLYGTFGSGALVQRLLIGTVFLLWGLRLKWYLLLRYLRHTQEDSRYRALREKWGPEAPRRFLSFFLGQAFSTLWLGVPLILGAANPSETIEAVQWVGLVLWAVGFLGESVADFQMWWFRADPRNAGAVMDRGLWRYSRHPNYFFEFVVWCGFGLVAVAAPYGWAALFGPVAMFYLLTRVTGVPASESLTKTSRSPAYEAYRRRTSPFFPRPPRSDS